MLSRTKTKCEIEGEMLHQNKETTPLFRELETDDMQWRPADSGVMTHSQTFYLVGTRGEFVFVQLARANLGFGPSCQVSVRYYHNPENGSGEENHKVPAINKFISQNIPFGEWNTDQDGISSVVGPLELRYTRKEFVVGFKTKEIELDIRIRLVAEVVSLEDGRLEFVQVEDEKAESLGIMEFYFCPRVQFDGSVRYINDDEEVEESSFEGVGSLNSIYQGIKPHKAAKYWVYNSFQGRSADGQTVSLIMLHLESLPTFDNQSVTQGILVMGDKVVSCSTSNIIRCSDYEKDKTSNYYIPKKVEYVWNGETDHGKPWEAVICIDIDQLDCVDKIDLLSHLPFLVRKLVQVFFTKPFSYEWLSLDVSARLTVDQDQSMIKGQFIHELTLLS